MNRELDELLRQRYPSIFRDRHAPMTDTCMCWCVFRSFVTGQSSST